MSKIKEYRNRIKSINNIKKITKSMQMIAVSKMRKAEKVAKTGKAYNRNIVDLFRLISKDTDLKNNPLFFKRDGGKKLIVVFSPNRGFAGSLLVSEMNLFLNKIKEFNGEEVEVIMVGRKLRKYVQGRVSKVIADFSEIGENPTIQEIKGVSKLILETYLDGEYDEVFVLYADYVNSLIQKPTLTRLLPAQLGESDGGEELYREREFLFEPERSTLLDSLVSLYVDNTLFQLRAETVASEYAARMSAMKNATDKAEDLGYVLNLELNKLRQDTITRELGEITSATI